MIQLKKITYDNIWKVIKLSVTEEQNNFVATNTQSLLEAYLTLDNGCVALPFAIYNDDTLVGFIMFGYGTTGDEDEPKIADGNYVLWRLMIDKSFQGRGYGKSALSTAIEYLKTYPCGEAGYCWTSYEPENTVAASLYRSFGFAENGEMCGDEIVAVIELK